MTLLQVALYFSVLSLISVGGLPTVIPEMQRYLVDVKGWISAEDFLAMFAVGQAAPGPNILIVSLLGWKIAGIGGALVALLAMCGPAAVLTWWVADLWDRFKENRWRVAIQRAMAPIVVGVIFAGGYVIATPTGTPDWRLWLIAAASAAGFFLRGLNPLWLLAAGAGVGAWLLA